MRILCDKTEIRIMLIVFHKSGNCTRSMWQKMMDSIVQKQASIEKHAKNSFKLLSRCYQNLRRRIQLSHYKKTDRILWNSISPATFLHRSMNARHCLKFIGNKPLLIIFCVAVSLFHSRVGCSGKPGFLWNPDRPLRNSEALKSVVQRFWPI